MADFMQAYNWAKAGKKVVWISDGIVNHTIFDKDYEKLLWTEDTPDGKLVTLNRNTKDGWEIYKEDSLSDKIVSVAGESTHMISKDNVKEFIKKEDELEIQCPIATVSFIDGVIFAKEEMKKARHKLAGKKLT